MFNVTFSLPMLIILVYICFILNMFHPKWKYFLFHVFCSLLIRLHRKDKSTKNGESWKENLQNKNQALVRKNLENLCSCSLPLTTMTVNGRNPTGAKVKRKKQQKIRFGEDGDVFNAANIWEQSQKWWQNLIQDILIKHTCAHTYIHT